MSHTSITVSFGIRFSKPPNVFYDLWLSLSSAHSSLWLTLRLSRERPLRLSVIEYQSTPDGEDVMGARGRIRDWETHGEPRTWIFLSPPHNSPLRGDMVTRQNISFIVFSMLFTRHTRPVHLLQPTTEETGLTFTSVRPPTSSKSPNSIFN